MVLFGAHQGVWALGRRRESQWERGSRHVKNGCALGPRHGGGIAQAEWPEGASARRVPEGPREGPPGPNKSQGQGSFSALG